MASTSTSASGEPVPEPAPLFTPAYFADPYPTYAAMRRSGPIFRSERMGTLILRHAVIRDLARCPHLSKALLEESRLDGLPDAVKRVAQPMVARSRYSMLRTDPPVHTRLRGQAMSAFTMRAMEGLRPSIQRMAHELLDGIAGRASVDIIRDFAFPLPAKVIMELLGVPHGDRDQLKQWTSDGIAFLGELRTAPDPMAIATRAVTSGKALRAYATELIAEKRMRPKNDFISALVAIQQEEDGRLDEEEVIAQSTLLLAAGHETTTNLIANGLLALVRNPHQMATLRARPELARSAVDEMLRYDAPVQVTSRVPTQDVEIAGQTLHAGKRIWLMLGAANRDPEHYANAESFDIARGANDHLAFGFDRHLCLGAHLARIEGEIAFRAMLERYSEIQLADDRQLEWHPNFAFRALKQLPVVLRTA